MKIKIESDVFDIVERIKEIDDGYIILYNCDNNKFEIHNTKQYDTYCFTSRYDCLSMSTIFETLSSLTIDIDKIIEEIDNNNNSIEQKNKIVLKDYGDYAFKEIYQYYNNSSKEYDQKNAFSTIWR